MSLIRLKVRQKTGGMLLHEITVSKLPFRIGRGEGCDLVLNEKTVSRQHIEIRASREGLIEVINLSSSNGLYVNGAKLTSFTAKDHSEFRISTYVIELDIEEEEETEPVQAPSARIRAPSGFVSLPESSDSEAEAIHHASMEAEHLDEAPEPARVREAVFETDLDAEAEISLEIPHPKKRQMPRGIERLLARFLELTSELEAGEPDSFRKTGLIAAAGGAVLGLSSNSGGNFLFEVVFCAAMAAAFAFGAGAIAGILSQRLGGEQHRKPLARIGAAAVLLWCLRAAILSVLGLNNPDNPIGSFLDGVLTAGVVIFYINFTWRRIHSVPDEKKFRRLLVVLGGFALIAVMNEGGHEKTEPTGFHLEASVIPKSSFSGLGAERSLKELQGSLGRSFLKVRTPAGLAVKTPAR